MSTYYNLLIEYFRNYNIWFLGILIIIQAFGIPTGATLVVIAAGALAFAGEFNIIILILEVWIFSSLGDIIAYILWKTVGVKLLTKFSRLNMYFQPKLTKMHIYLNRHGKSTVFFTRFLLSPMGPSINVAAGIARYEWVTFSIFVSLGELFWTCIYLGLGYWFADSWDTLIPVITQLTLILTCFSILIAIIYFLIKFFRVKEDKT